MNLREAESAIAEILKQLETDTGCVVDSVQIHSVEITGLMDDRPKHQQSVCIETHRLPGHQWG